MPADLKSILRLEVPLSVQIASRPMRVREISALSPGAIVELPKLADEQLDVTIGGRRIGMGTAVKVGENFGVRITHVGTMRQRIAAMGPRPAIGGDTALAEGGEGAKGKGESEGESGDLDGVGNSTDENSEDSRTDASQNEDEPNLSEP